jgi:uncharacterized protein with ParB-like and HNH nuclease domain|tara:strand:+ start:106 stop:1836 length:1731 start_codon:yes stop_codon:yes gene_type:complete
MELRSIDKLLQYGIFTIPDYQRGYSWGKEQLIEFFEDLIDVEYVKEHYTGTVTIIKSGSEKIGVKTHITYDLVDGQQRLTTIHLLLSALYFRLKKINKEDEDIIRNVIYKEKTLLRLNNKKNQEYFTYIIKNDITNINDFECENKTQKNLKFAKEYFSKSFERLNYKKLILIYSNLITKFKVNIFELQEEAEVGLIFETMNDRGLPLSDIDKIKNYLIYISHRLSENNLAKDINRKFGEMFKELMKVQSTSNVTKSENLFLKNSYLIFTGETRDLNDIHKKVKTKLIPKKHIFKNPNIFTTDQKLKDDKIKSIKDFTSFLVKSSKEYAKILNCDFNDELINEGLTRLKILNKLDTFIPILLAISTSKRWQNKEHLRIIIELLEIFALRVSFIGNRKANTGIIALNEIAYSIRINKTNFTKVKKDIRNLINKNISIREFKKEIVTREYYGKGIDELVKYFLYEYEVYRSKENNSNFKLPCVQEFFLETKGYSIEHIHPQKPVIGDIKVSNIHLLGNLVLTKDNSSLDNKIFESKKRIYAISELTSENDLLSYEKWDDKEILERGKLLSKFGQDRWKI